jgi:hypothetical protein
MPKLNAVLLFIGDVCAADFTDLSVDCAATYSNLLALHTSSRSLRPGLMRNRGNVRKFILSVVPSLNGDRSDGAGAPSLLPSPLPVV